MSLVRAHQARVLASFGGRVMVSVGASPAHLPLPANDGGPPAASSRAGPIVAEARAYQQQLAQLGVDERRLKSIQSIERKIAAKRTMLPAYQPWVDGRLDGDHPVSDAVVATVMVWSMDVGDWSRALDIAAHVLRHDLPLPARFTRTPACAIAEMVADAACAAHARGEDFDAAAIARARDLTADHDIPDEVRARLHKAMGQQLTRAADIPVADLIVIGDGPRPTPEQHADMVRRLRELALVDLRRARELDSRAGVVGLIQRLERAQAKERAADAG